LANLKNINNLQIIRLIYASVVGRGFEELKKQNNLKSIHWISCNTDDDVNRLYNLYSLVDLHLSSGLRDQRQINDSDLEGIERLSSLKILRLSSKKSIGDAGVTRISNLSNLISLEIFDSVITDHSLEKIGQLKLLENLYIDSDLITGQGLSFFQNLDKLEALSICASTKSFRAGNLVNLTSLSNLASLSLASMVLDDNAMEKIGNINKLYRLQLSAVHVSSNGLRHLRNLPRLRHLDMMCIRQLDDIGFEHIGSLSSLQSLSFSANFFKQGSVTITNKGMTYISKLTNLQNLRTYGMKINENSIEHIAKMTNLRNLYISRSGIGENAVSEVRKALPNCRINDNWN
jgi:hypothetical protein